MGGAPDLVMKIVLEQLLGQEHGDGHDLHRVRGAVHHVDDRQHLTFHRAGLTNLSLNCQTSIWLKVLFFRTKLGTALWSYTRV